MSVHPAISRVGYLKSTSQNIKVEDLRNALQAMAKDAIGIGESNAAVADLADFVIGTFANDPEMTLSYWRMESHEG